MRSLPGPPRNESEPPAPITTSCPSPPSRRSAPGPPRRTSFPPPPRMVSSPPKPQITSREPVPLSVSSPRVPLSVHDGPQAAVAREDGLPAVGSPRGVEIGCLISCQPMHRGPIRPHHVDIGVSGETPTEDDGVSARAPGRRYVRGAIRGQPPDMRLLGCHHVDVHVLPRSRGLEGDRSPVRRPGGERSVRDLFVPPSQPPEARAIRMNDVELVVPVNRANEGDPPPVGRPA